MKWFVFLVLFSFFVAPVFAQTPQLTVMTYNIHHGDQLDVNEHRTKIRTIMSYIKQNNIEIAGLQEVSSKPDPDVSDIIKQELDAIGYSMYMAVPPSINENYFKNVIISRYPIENPQWIGQNPCRSSGTCDRWIVIGTVRTPYGPVQFINTHVHHGSDNCASVDQFYNKIQSLLSNKTTIITGDFNTTLFSKDCGTKLGNLFAQECTNAAQCVQGPIDWIFLPKNSTTLSQINRVVDKSITASDHFPIIANIRFNNPIVPTATPAPTQLPTRLPTPTIVPTVASSISSTAPGVSPSIQASPQPPPTGIALAPTSSIPLIPTISYKKNNNIISGAATSVLNAPLTVLDYLLLFDRYIQEKANILLQQYLK